MPVRFETSEEDPWLNAVVIRAASDAAARRRDRAAARARPARLPLSRRRRARRRAPCLRVAVAARAARRARAGRTTRRRGRTSTSMPSCSAISTAAPQAATESASRRRGHERDGEREQHGGGLHGRLSASSPLHSPQIENGESRSPWKPSVRSQNMRRSPPSEHRQHRDGAASANASAKATNDTGPGPQRGSARRVARRAREQRRRARAARTSSGRRARRIAPRAGGRPRRPAASRRAAARRARRCVFVERGVERERERRPRVGEHDPERRAADAPAEQEQAERSSAGRRRSPRRARRAGRPSAAPRQELLERARRRSS